MGGGVGGDSEGGDGDETRAPGGQVICVVGESQGRVSRCKTGTVFDEALLIFR